MNHYPVRVTITQADGYEIASNVHGDLKIIQDRNRTHWGADLHIPALQDTQAVHRSFVNMTQLQIVLRGRGGERTATGFVQRFGGRGTYGEVDIALTPDTQDHADFTAAFTE